MNDPNGCHRDRNGTYHLYYQYNPLEYVAGNQHWVESRRVEGVDGDDAVGRVREEARRVVRVEHCRTGEPRPLCRQQPVP
jgi:IS4 transposase